MPRTAFIHYGINKQAELIIVCYHEPVTAARTYKKFTEPYQLSKSPLKLHATIENVTSENIKEQILQKFKEVQTYIANENINISKIILAADVNLCSIDKEALADFLIDDASVNEIFGTTIPIIRILESSLKEVIKKAIERFLNINTEIKSNQLFVFRTKSGHFDEKNRINEFFGPRPSPRLGKLYKLFEEPGEALEVKDNTTSVKRRLIEQDVLNEEGHSKKSCQQSEKKTFFPNPSEVEARSQEDDTVWPLQSKSLTK
ncbi:hypothetical protein ACQUW5_08490 [Legionella sp. CNM-1927-20]|uniref:hypothetical protein n=1 Tax=Legionella sp. CNM-1927-20 TaxID=3422221 RepID=UPI00403B0C1B